MPRRPSDKRIPNECLRDYRLLRGWSQDDLANELIRLGYEAGDNNLGVSQKMVSDWERGASKPRPPYPKLLVRLFGVSAQELGLHAPTRLNTYEPPEDDIERRTFLETMVGAAFLPVPLGLSLEDFLHEPRRYLTAWATTPTRELLPPALGCLWLAEASGSDQAACEASVLLAWLAYDLGDDARMRQHYRDAAEHARRAGSPRLLAYTLLGWSSYTDDGPTAIRLVEQAKAVLPDGSPDALRQLVNDVDAVTASKVGAGPKAWDALARLEPTEPGWPVTFPVDGVEVIRCRGRVAVRLGRPDNAIPALESVLETYGAAPNKRRPYVMMELAGAYRQADDHEQAQRLLAEAQQLGHKLGLRRLLVNRV